MRSADLPEGGAGQVGREVGATTSRPTPLALVSDAVAGGDLRGVAETVARTLGCPVAIAIPALGPPALLPEGAGGEAILAAIGAHATRAVAEGELPADRPRAVREAVPVRIAGKVVGIVAAVVVPAPEDGAGPGPRAGADRHAWLEAAATAASVTALIREAHGGPAQPAAGAEILGELSAAEPADLSGVLARARRAGVELRGGAIALAARRGPAVEDRNGLGDPGALGLLARLPTELRMLVASPSEGRLHALVPLTAAAEAGALAEGLRCEGWTAVLSTPRRDPAQLRQALLEAELLAELHALEELAPAQEDTYRLLIRILLRDPAELELLREQTISPLAEYDARHDTELLATLRAFLRHDGSTTETAVAMRLHRHTVGYRLSRVHEVSGLSPYGSTGRERLGLGLKAAQIILAAERRTEHQVE